MTISLNYHKVQQLTSLVFTVATDDNATNYLTADEIGKYDALMIVCDEAALTGTVTLAVIKDLANDDETADVSWATLQSPPGTDVAIAADKAVVVTDLPAAAIRLESSAAEAADRTFFVYGLLATVSGA
jgi:hypothetical protein